MRDSGSATAASRSAGAWQTVSVDGCLPKRRADHLAMGFKVVILGQRSAEEGGRKWRGAPSPTPAGVRAVRPRGVRHWRDLGRRPVGAHPAAAATRRVRSSRAPDRGRGGDEASLRAAAASRSAAAARRGQGPADGFVGNKTSGCIASTTAMATARFSPPTAATAPRRERCAPTAVSAASRAQPRLAGRARVARTRKPHPRRRWA